MTSEQFKTFLNKNPNKSFCLHNGFDGYNFGMPISPKRISYKRALKILSRYEKLTGIDPIFQYDKLWYCDSLIFKDKSWFLRVLTLRRMIGFYTDALYNNPPESDSK